MNTVTWWLGWAGLGVGGFLVAAAMQGEEQMADAGVVVISWGHPALTIGDEVQPMGPDWCVAASRQGGDWIGASGQVKLPAWRIRATDSQVAALIIRLDREQVFGDLTLQAAFAGSSGALLVLDLLDVTGAVLVDGVASGQVIKAEAGERFAATLPLARWPAAATVRLRRASGDLTVYHTTLAPAGTGAADVPVGISPVTEPVSVVATDGSRRDAVSVTNSLKLVPGAPDTQRSGAVLPATNRSRSRVSPSGAVYVDAAIGHDAQSGRRRELQWVARAAGAAGPAFTLDGPKRTVAAGQAAVRDGERLVIREGAYADRLALAGREVRVRIEGQVRLTRPNRGLVPAHGPVTNAPIRGVEAAISTNRPTTMEAPR